MVGEGEEGEEDAMGEMYSLLEHAANQLRLRWPHCRRWNLQTSSLQPTKKGTIIQRVGASALAS